MGWRRRQSFCVNAWLWICSGSNSIDSYTVYSMLKQSATPNHWLVWLAVALATEVGGTSVYASLCTYASLCDQGKTALSLWSDLFLDRSHGAWSTSWLVLVPTRWNSSMRSPIAFYARWDCFVEGCSKVFCVWLQKVEFLMKRRRRRRLGCGWRFQLMVMTQYLQK